MRRDRTAGPRGFQPFGHRPVPGGVGPVTHVWLLHNTVLAARLLAGHPSGTGR